MGKPTGKIEQNFIAARPTDQRDTGRATRDGPDRDVDLWKAAKSSNACQSHGPHPK